MSYTKETINKLNQDIRTYFPLITEISDSFHIQHDGVSRLVMLDRYAQKDRELVSLGVGDLVVTVIKEDPKYPARGIGFVKRKNTTTVRITYKTRSCCCKSAFVRFIC